MSQLMFTSRIGLAMSLSLLLAASARAAIVAQHLANNDPTTEGWSAFLGTDVTGTASATGPSWYLNDASNTAHGYYVQDLTNAQLPNGAPFVLTVNIRVDAAPDQFINQYVELADGLSLWQISFRYDRNLYYYDGSGPSSIVGSYSPSGAFGTVTMTLDQGANTLDPADDVLVIDDGIGIFNLPRSSVGVNLTSDKTIAWGAGNNGVTTDAYWAEVTLSAVPEPTSSGLFLAGSLAFLAARKRRSL